MGFMDQFNQMAQQVQPTRQQPQQLSQAIQMAKQKLGPIMQMAGGDSGAFVNYLRQTNGDFDRFCVQNIDGKTKDQVLQSFGIDQSIL